MLTARALVGTRELGLIVLVPGPPGAMDAEVVWVHTTDLADPSRYVGRSELVMTNGLWRSQVSAASYVERCCAAGAAGIIYGLLKDTPACPQELIEACTHADLLLLQLPIDVPFVAVSQAASDIRATDRQMPLVTALQRADAFADALTAKQGATEFLRVLRDEYQDLPLALVDRTGTLLAQAGMTLTDEDQQATATALTSRPPPLELTLGSGTATLLPIGHVVRPEAALLCLRPTTELSDTQQGALNQAAHYLAAEIARRQQVRATEERFAHELLDMITSGVGSAPDIAQRLVAFGLEPKNKLVVLALSSRSDTEMRDLAQAAGTALAGRNVPALIVPGSQDVVAVCAWRHPENTLMDWCNTLASDLARHASVIATADPVSSVSSLRNALLEARRTAQVLRTSRNVTVARLTDLPTYHTLLGRIDQQLVQDLARILDPLLAYDEQHTEGDLEDTLRNLLAHKGNQSATARDMRLHINSLRRRFERIRKLTGRDPLVLPECVDLLLAMEAKELLTLQNGKTTTSSR